MEIGNQETGITKEMGNGQKLSYESSQVLSMKGSESS
jgi:hypothetical protein